MAELLHRISRKWIRISGWLIALSLGLYLWNSSYISELVAWISQDNIQTLVVRAGYWGPLLIIGLMTLAVVASPIPSAPIALAAGAAYGHFYGTIFVLIGAEAGAIIAFLLARILGRKTIERWFGSRLSAGLLGSQNALTLTVFASRLLPFVSFDLVSYAAGLSYLRFWRFALATLAGIIPASFLLAHFGSEAATGDLGRATWAVLGLGMFTLVPIIFVSISSRRKKGSPD